ncbi:MAG: hypothetical protein GY853_00565 [PVC group bacterium]|nr:hypothetical protein [PVC group bacterium]
MGLFDALMHKDYLYIGEMINEQRKAIERINDEENMKNRHIYLITLLGDPSLTPYIGIPEKQNFSCDKITQGDKKIKIKTTPYAYIALSNSKSKLIGTGYSDKDGNVEIEIEPISSTEVKIVVTAKFRIPVMKTITIYED